MSFDDALQDNPIPLKVGDVRLRYESSLLIGEVRPALRSLLPEGLWIGGAAFGVLTAAVLLVPESFPSTLVGAVTGALCGLFVLAAMLAEQQQRTRRGFVLNFGTESLRVDAVSWRRKRARTWVVKFDFVRSVEVVPRGKHRFGLVVRFSPEGDAHTREELLVDQALPSEIEELRRLWRVLHNAFGLRSAPAVSRSVDTSLLE